jgi:3-oxoadipate enol-lactonase/4-carboxymuconolactone decarboxylase
MIGLWLGVHAKSRVSKLALMCTSAYLAPPEAWRDRAAQVRQSGPGAVAESSVARWFTPGFAESHAELVTEMRAMVARTSVEGYAACCEAIASWDIRGQLSAIEAPTQLLAGGADPSTPPSHAYAIAAAIPNARVTVLEHAAHLALAERPERVTQWLLEHLDPTFGLGIRTDGDRARVGEQVRREVLGDAYVDRARASTTDLTIPFQEFITRYAWGEIWSRPGLARSERSLITLSVLAALRHDGEFAIHVAAALRNGLSVEQLRELLLQVAIYAGVPAANHAFAVAQRVLNER